MPSRQRGSQGLPTQAPENRAGESSCLPPTWEGQGGSPEASGSLLAPRRARICGKEDSPREAELAGTAHAFLQPDPGVPWAPHSPPTERLSLPGCINLFLSVHGRKKGAVGSSGWRACQPPPPHGHHHGWLTPGSWQGARVPDGGSMTIMSSGSPTVGWKSGKVFTAWGPASCVLPGAEHGLCELWVSQRGGEGLGGLLGLTEVGGGGRRSPGDHGRGGLEVSWG